MIFARKKENWKRLSVGREMTIFHLYSSELKVTLLIDSPMVFFTGISMRLVDEYQECVSLS